MKKKISFSLNLTGSTIKAKQAAELLNTGAIITSLDLSRCSIFAMLDSNVMPGLEANATGNENFQRLAIAFEKNKSITTLILSSNKITSVKAGMIAAIIEKNSIITHLDISNNELRDTGAKLIAQALKHNTSLVSINFTNNYFSNQGSAALDKIVLLKSNIIFAKYDNQSVVVAEELRARQFYINSLITSWLNYNEHEETCEFTGEISDYIKNASAIKFMITNGGYQDSAKLAQSFDTFLKPHKEIEARNKKIYAASVFVGLVGFSGVCLHALYTRTSFPYNIIGTAGLICILHVPNYIFNYFANKHTQPNTPEPILVI